jgi:hypothetical protein
MKFCRTTCGAVFAAVLLVFLRTVPAGAQEKYALVIGNGAYSSITKLNNPVNDANDMKAALESLGFRVEGLLNANRVQMEEAVERFKNKLRGSKTSYGFLFYAGHGVQSNGENYLIPVDADIRSESYLRDRAVSVQAVLDELNAAGNGLNVVVLDACRDNPFSWKRSGSRGLQVVSNQPADSIIVYATGAGSTAADGEGRNGLFTSQLLKNLKTPGLEINEVFRLTGGEVARASEGRQRPAVYNQFYGTAYLSGTAQAPTPTVRPQSQEKVYTIGERGPAGGWIFYDKGSYTDDWRYLEAAPGDVVDSVVGWGLYGKTVGATETAVGSGRRNTQLIMAALQQAGETGRAAQVSAAFSAGGFTDWFLPSRDELNLIYQNLKTKGLGNFGNLWYWSSSEGSSSVARVQHFSDGRQNPGYKFDTYSVRAVRAF